jgi:hypothetical protein
MSLILAMIETTYRLALGYIFSIPDNVIGIFHWHNLSGRIMFLGRNSC